MVVPGAECFGMLSLLAARFLIVTDLAEYLTVFERRLASVDISMDMVEELLLQSEVSFAGLA